MRKSLSSIASPLCTAVFVLLLAATPVMAQSAWTSTTEAKCVTDTDVATIQGIECLVGNILATAMTFIGIAAFVMFLIGSFRYMTAGANTKGVESGKNAFSFAVLGIVVALASFVILRFITSFTGVTTILNFSTQIQRQ